MKRKSLLAASAIFAILAGASAAQANAGGGSSGGGDSGPGLWGLGNPHGFFGGPGGGGVVMGRPLIAAPEPSGSTTLPGGTHLRLDGFKANRDVFIATPEHGRFKGKHIKTTFNPATGITSVWMRNADGSRTGVHTDSQGNQMISEHSR